MTYASYIYYIYEIVTPPGAAGERAQRASEARSETPGQAILTIHTLRPAHP